MKELKEKFVEIFRYYSINKPLIFNNKEINKVSISNHYEINHGDYMNDKLVLKIVSQLDKNIMKAKSKGILPNSLQWWTIAHEPFYEGKKAYRLILYLEENRDILWVLNCFMRKKYDRK